MPFQCTAFKNNLNMSRAATKRQQVGSRVLANSQEVALKVRALINQIVTAPPLQTTQENFSIKMHST